MIIFLLSDEDMLRAFALSLEQRAEAYQLSAGVALHWTRAFLRLVLADAACTTPSSHATRTCSLDSASPVLATLASAGTLPAEKLSVRKRIERLMHGISLLPRATYPQLEVKLPAGSS